MTHRWRDLAAFVAYTLLALIFTYPLVTALGTATLGTGHDGWQDTWEMWWLNRAIATGAHPYTFDTLYAPYGATNYLHSLNPVLGVVALPVQWLFGAVAAYNTMCLAALTLTAFAAYLLGRDASGSRLGGFTAGLVVGFAPRQFGHLLGHLDVVSIQFFIFAVWCLFRGLAASGRTAITWLLWSGACVAAAALTHPYALISASTVIVFLGIWKGVAAARAAKWKPNAQVWHPPLRALLALGVGIAVVAPLLLAMAGQLAGPDAPRRRDIAVETIQERRLYSADLLSYTLPNPFHPLWGELSRQTVGSLGGGLSERIVFPGYIALALALFGAVARGTRGAARPWWVLALVGLVMSLGATLKIGDDDTGIPLPTAPLYLLPGTEMVRVPARFSMIFTLGLGVCAALGTAVMAERLGRARAGGPKKRLAGAATTAAAALVIVEYLPLPFPVAYSDYIPWHRALNARPGPRSALLEVPFAPGDAQPLMRQMEHGLALAGGYLSRQPAEPLSGGVPPFAELGLNRDLENRPFDRDTDTICRPMPEQATYLDIMRLAGVRYVGLHPFWLPKDDPRPRVLQELFGWPPAYWGQRVLVYDTQGGDPSPRLLGITEDWEDWYDVEGGFRWALTRTPRLHIWSGARRAVTLHLGLRSIRQERGVSVRVGDQVLKELRVGLDLQEVELNLSVRRGFTTVTFVPSGPSVSPEELDGGLDNRPLTVGMEGCRIDEQR